MSKELQLRDFIYMDIERLKSILSQVEEGLVEQLTKSTSKNESKSKENEAGFPKAFRISDREDVIWQNQSTESKTLHDHIYNYVEYHLKEKNKLLHIPGSVSSDDVLNGDHYDILTDTSFILVKGQAFINDFEYLQKLLNSFNDMMGTIVKDRVVEQVAASIPPSMPHKKRKELTSKAVNEAIEEHTIKPDLLDLINNTINIFYKNKIIFKMVPFDNTELGFTGPLKSTYLREDIYDIIYKYGTSPTSKWTMLAQIASIPTLSDVQTISPAGHNQFEQALKEAFDSLRGMENMGFKVSYPEIGITPIAIYRE